MLKDPKFSPVKNPFAAMIARANERGGDYSKLASGMYLSGHWSAELDILDKLDTWPHFDVTPELSCIGVCDYPSQLIEKFPHLKTSQEHYVIFFVKIEKAKQSAEGGWRWHKWGTYIGEHAPCTEYLYDEPAIDEVYTYHIYQFMD